MKIENRQQFLIALVAVAAGLLIGNSLIYEPLAKWWAVRSQKITQLRQQVKNGKYLVVSEQALRGQWERMRANTLPNNTSLAEQQVLKARPALRGLKVDLETTRSSTELSIQKRPVRLS